MKCGNLFALGQGIVRGCLITIIVWVTSFFLLLLSYILILPRFWSICDNEIFLAEVEWNGYRQNKGYTHEAF